MKNVIKHSKKGILMVTLFATMLSFANEVSFYSIKNDAGRTSLTLNHVKEGNLLSIKDNKGVILFKEFMEKTGTYKKGFDLTALPNGSYIFELDKDMEITIIPFTVMSKSVLFNKELEKTIFKPYANIKGNVVYVTKLSLNKEPLKIDIYFTGSSYLNGSEKVYSEKIEDKINIERVFELKGLEEGSYRMVFHSEGRVFTKIIN